MFSLRADNVIDAAVTEAECNYLVELKVLAFLRELVKALPASFVIPSTASVFVYEDDLVVKIPRSEKMIRQWMDAIAQWPAQFQCEITDDTANSGIFRIDIRHPGISTLCWVRLRFDPMMPGSTSVRRKISTRTETVAYDVFCVEERS